MRSPRLVVGRSSTEGMQIEGMGTMSGHTKNMNVDGTSSDDGASGEFS